MSVVNVHEAKTHLSKLLARVEDGEEIIIARGGRPIARLAPLERKPRRVPGEDAGRIRMSDDFDAALPLEILQAFEK